MPILSLNQLVTCFVLAIYWRWLKYFITGKSIIPLFPFSFVDDARTLIAQNPKIYKKRDNKVKDMMDDPEMKLALFAYYWRIIKFIKQRG